MMRIISLALLGISLFLSSCSTESSIGGLVLFEGKPVAQARVEFYLKSGSERSSSPFSVATTDLSGKFSAVLPAGEYYLVGKKKEQGGGLNRMLMAEYPQNPVRMQHGAIQINNMELQEVGFEGAIASDGKTQAAGSLFFQQKPLANAFVYVYTSPDSLTGPAYGLVVRADDEGHFGLNLSAGTYWLAARKRNDGSRVGDPQVGDLNGEYPRNPLVMKTGDKLTLAPWTLESVTREQKLKRLAQGKFTRTSTWLSGRVIDEDNSPIAGIYLFAYRDSRMIGKPNFISNPTDADGVFRLYLDHGGEFFIGARSTFGGPLEPGEWVGTYDEKADHSVVAQQDAETKLGEILVREVW